MTDGDSKTLMIVQLAPGQANMHESLSSLNFADKVSRIQTKGTALSNHLSSISSAKINNKCLATFEIDRATMSSKWVSALHDYSAAINSLPACIGLSDLHGDGDYKLIIGDIGTGRYNMRLKVFKGLTLVGESVLTDVPSAVVPFINELMQPTLPSIAISSGSSVLIYKNLKPFYKFNIPPMEVNETEAEAWSHAEASQIDSSQLFVVLSKLSEQLGTGGLTSRSQAFLQCKEEERDELIERCRGKKLVRRSTITCMATLKKSSSDTSGIDCIIIGTEIGLVYCVDSQAFTLLSQCILPAAPVFIHATGVYDVEYRIFVSSREAEVFTIKRGVESLERPTITLKSDIIGMVRVSKQLVVACEDRTISFFSTKGRRQNQMTVDSPIRCIDVFVYAPRQYTALLVALDNEVRIYHELFLMDRLKIDAPIKWIRYGPMGREEGALVIGTRNGGLIVKLFRRTAKLEQKCEEMGPPAAQSKKLNVPRRTKIFVDQTIREREQAQTMHQVFQRDLFMLRLSVTRSFADLTHSSLNTVSTKKNEAVEISVEINGFGPTFRMIVKLRVASVQPLESHWLTFHYNEEMYAFDECLIPLPALVSGMSYTFDTLVHCLNPEKGLSSDVRILLSAKSNIIVAALVTMPISEASLLD